jgi:hypothetical protein
MDQQLPALNPTTSGARRRQAKFLAKMKKSNFLPGPNFNEASSYFKFLSFFSKYSIFLMFEMLLVDATPST